MAASSTAALKDARLAHTGEKSPIALANREIGALPPAAAKGRARCSSGHFGRNKTSSAIRTGFGC